MRTNAQGVASASAQIAASNHDLSGRTEEQASALEETAASMEQLSSTVKHNADNARQANQMAVSASTVAAQGGEAVTEVVEIMNSIDESSRRIADIMRWHCLPGPYPGLECVGGGCSCRRTRPWLCRGSEHGGALSRSGQGNQGLDHEQRGACGARYAIGRQGRQHHDRVVAAIRRVTDIMGEISAASHEQSSGVSQIGEAVTQMDQTTQQNAALVEEMAAAASSLNN